MKKSIPILAVVQTIVLSVFAYSANIEEREDIQKILRFSDPKGENLVVVDNISGSISVTGYDGEEVKLTIQKVIQARSKQKLSEAKEKVHLDILEEDNLIELYVDGPFRGDCKKSRHWRGWKREGYKVIYDFELKVPKEVDLDLETVNEGEIFVENIQGRYDINNINGGIDMQKISGSGRAYALNGDLRLVFQRNPGEDCYFGSLNGEVKIYLLSPLSADFRLKTFNGEVYSDFPVNYIPTEPDTTIKQKGKKVYKIGRTMTVRAGKGGPQIDLDGFNGDMYILKKIR